LKATALLFPLILVVDGMSHDSQDKYLLTRIEDASDQARLVSANVEHDAVSNQIGIAERQANFTPILPRNGLVTDVGEPRTKRTF